MKLSFLFVLSVPIVAGIIAWHMPLQITPRYEWTYKPIPPHDDCILVESYYWFPDASTTKKGNSGDFAWDCKK